MCIVFMCEPDFTIISSSEFIVKTISQTSTVLASVWCKNPDTGSFYLASRRLRLPLSLSVNQHHEHKKDPDRKHTNTLPQKIRLNGRYNPADLPPLPSVASEIYFCWKERERERRQDEFRHQVTNVATDGADGITPSSVTYQRHVTSLTAIVIG